MMKENTESFIFIYLLEMCQDPPVIYWDTLRTFWASVDTKKDTLKVSNLYLYKSVSIMEGPIWVYFEDILAPRGETWRVLLGVSDPFR